MIPYRFNYSWSSLQLVHILSIGAPRGGWGGCWAAVPPKAKYKNRFCGYDESYQRSTWL